MTTTAPDEQNSLSIGEVAARTGLSVHTLRLYEREGLLVGPVQRTSGGRRRYTGRDVDWLSICVKLRESGMPLADLKRFAELVRQGPGNEAERLQLLDTHRQRVDSQIKALEDCRTVITWKVGVYADHLARGEADGLWDPTNTERAVDRRVSGGLFGSRGRSQPAGAGGEADGVDAIAGLEFGDGGGEVVADCSVGEV
ncbi:MerR family transcriptional regulator [Nocardia acididurans]|uniref:MerR family transcriptional regulator n=1 Tax=Nocardia acididurans TaxID=2802282 RepID=UPI0027DB34F2|nr:MerR family transcriptional regulator [Nocardia acididurans]